MYLNKYWLLFVFVCGEKTNENFMKAKIKLIVIFRVENDIPYQFCSRAGFIMTGARAKRLIAEAEHTRRDSTLPFNQYLSGVLREKSEEKVKLILPSSNW